jgi:hypothetical protein
LKKINKQKEFIAKIEENKILFTGTGGALEVQIRKVISELGFSVEKGSIGRADLIANYNDKVAVIEIKGVTKSAAEKNAAQLEKSVSEYFEANGNRSNGHRQ